MKVADFEVVKLARRVAEKQLEWYKSMMKAKESNPWPFPKAKDHES